MNRYHVYIYASGGGSRFTLGWTPTLFLAEELVKQFDRDFLEWEVAGHPELNDDDPLAHYEGCDIYATETISGDQYELEGENETDPVKFKRVEE